MHTTVNVWRFTQPDPSLTMEPPAGTASSGGIACVDRGSTAILGAPGGACNKPSSPQSRWLVDPDIRWDSTARTDAASVWRFAQLAREGSPLAQRTLVVSRAWNSGPSVVSTRVYGRPQWRPSRLRPELLDIHARGRETGWIVYSIGEGDKSNEWSAKIGWVRPTRLKLSFNSKSLCVQHISQTRGSRMRLARREIGISDIWLYQPQGRIT